MTEEQKPKDWCECYGCTTMRHPCIVDDFWTKEKIDEAKLRAQGAAEVTLPIEQFNGLLELAERLAKAGAYETQ